jgi:hypothetical protein
MKKSVKSSEALIEVDGIKVCVAVLEKAIFLSFFCETLSDNLAKILR